jgi:hypothetical protein
MTKLAYVLALAALATPALAQEPATVAPAQPPPKTLGVDGAVVVPVGDYATVAKVAAGALLRLEVPVGSGYITGRGGLIAHATDDRYAMATFLLMPIYGGYRQPLGPSGAYVAGELGLTIGYVSGSASTPFGNVDGSDTDTDLGLTLCAGFRTGKLDLRGGLFSPNAEDFGLIASAGLDFTAF